MPATLDDEPVSYLRPVPRPPRPNAAAWAAVAGGGCRTALAVRGGLEVPAYLGSRTTFTLGGFGGHGGRALRRGDVLHVGAAAPLEEAARGARRAAASRFRTAGKSASCTGPTARRTSSRRGTSRCCSPPIGRSTTTPIARAFAWWGRSRSGPGATAAKRAYTLRTSTTSPTQWAPSTSRVTCRSCWDRTAPAWAASSARRRWSAAELWKLGQLRPGDRVRFVPLLPERAAELEQAQRALTARSIDPHR